ncbi:MAG: hypothetical protein WBQ08_02700 [Candidatus Sulfotelmatobacter sp.]
MHVHPSQINPNAQLDALYAAEKAAAKREAARTRRKLSEFASKLLGELESGEGCVVRLGADQESQEQGKGENQQRQGKGAEKQGRGDSRDANNSVSDWA